MHDIGKFHVKVSVIPNGLEKYMAFIFSRKLIFIGSMKFMNSSLDALVKNLSDNDFKYLSEEFSDEFFKLVKQKGLYPYEYMDSFLKINYLISVYFFSSFNDECVSGKDYLKFIDVWNVFKMKTMGDYYGIYLKADVLLLADVFEKFVNTCLDYYRLDPCNYFSSPGLSWDSMLRIRPYFRH